MANAEARKREIAAVVFDLDGVLVDSEQVWDDVREQLARERGGHWHAGAQADMMGMSSPEWSRYMRDAIGLPGSPAEINAEVVTRMLARYRKALPLIDGAVDAVRRLAASFPLAVASSSNRPLIETVLIGAGITDLFSVTVSSEEVDRGKPAPDVYLAATRRLGFPPLPLRGDRGLGERDPFRTRRRIAGVRDPERALPSRRRRARPGACRSPVPRGLDGRGPVRGGLLRTRRCLGPPASSPRHRP